MTRYCDKPDRDVPKIRCGYPLPCPFHTVVVDASRGEDEVTVEVPSRADVDAKTVRRLRSIGEAVAGRKK